MDSLCLRVAQMPRSRDVAIFMPPMTMTDKTNCFTPCTCAQEISRYYALPQSATWCSEYIKTSCCMWAILTFVWPSSFSKNLWKFIKQKIDQLLSLAKTLACLCTQTTSFINSKYRYMYNYYARLPDLFHMIWYNVPHGYPTPVWMHNRTTYCVMR